MSEDDKTLEDPKNETSRGDRLEEATTEGAESATSTGIAGQITDPATAELIVNGQLQLHLEQRKPTELDEVEAAAVITALWDIANTLEEDQLDRPVDEVLAEADYEQQLNTDKGRSVE